MSTTRLPRNVNKIHAAEIALGSINTKIAVAITKGLGTMVCAYIFVALAIFGFPGWGSTPPQYVQWISQTFIQLTALSVLAVGQNIQSRHAELVAEETYADAEASKAQLIAIQQELAAQRAILERMVKEQRA